MHNTTGWLLLALTAPPFNSTPIRVSLVTRPHSKAVPETADPSRHNTRATAENANFREQFMEVEETARPDRAPDTGSDIPPFRNLEGYYCCRCRTLSTSTLKWDSELFVASGRSRSIRK